MGSDALSRKKLMQEFDTEEEEILDDIEQFRKIYFQGRNPLKGLKSFLEAAVSFLAEAKSLLEKEDSCEREKSSTEWPFHSHKERVLAYLDRYSSLYQLISILEKIHYLCDLVAFEISDSAFKR